MKLWRRVLVVIGIASVAFYAACIHPTIQRFRQVTTTANMQTTCVYLTQYSDAHGAMPQLIADALPPSLSQEARYAFTHDAWDHPLMYDARGNTFVLVSYGFHGRPDDLDYWSIRARFENAKFNLDACSNPNADIIASDRGFQRPCGK